MTRLIFNQPDFLSRSNIYEVNIRQYTPEGTFAAFASHIPRLKDMGVEILWLMPIHPIGVVKRKGTLGSYYSIKNHRAINPEFGTDTDFRELVEKLHAAGMKIIIDWVANHTSWDNIWTISNPDFFVRDASGGFMPPYDWDDVIQIDHANKDEQEAMINAMTYWVTDFDIDGFRADLAHLTPLPFWKDARMKLTPIKKDLIWLAETEEPAYHEAFDISYTWKWMHATEKFSKGENALPDCINILTEYRNDFIPEALRLFFTSNHDENSWNGTEYEKYGSLAKAIAVFSCTYPGVPLIYSGQELPNKKRLKFFDKDEIEWERGIEMHEFYKVLFALRKRNTGVDGHVKIYEAFAAQNILAYERASANDIIMVVLNLNNKEASITIQAENLNGKFKNIFTEKVIDLHGEYLFKEAEGGFAVLEKIL